MTEVMRSHILYFRRFAVVPVAAFVSLVQQTKELERDFFPHLEKRLSKDFRL